MILYENKVSPEFIVKVKDVANRLGIDVNWLMAVMHLESAGTFSPSITNSLGYVGLIQFGWSASATIGTTQAKLKMMSAVEQLEYVYKYLAIYKRKITSYVDLYLAIFFPVALGKSKDFVLQAKNLPADKVARANPLFDINKDSKITVGEIEEKLMNRIPKTFLSYFKEKKIGRAHV